MDDLKLSIAANHRWLQLLGAPRVLTDDEVTELMALHEAISDREDPGARITGHLDG
jgi:hypothetical protein